MSEDLVGVSSTDETTTTTTTSSSSSCDEAAVQQRQQLYSSLLLADVVDVGPLQIVVEDPGTDDDQTPRDDDEEAAPPAGHLDNDRMDTACTSATDLPTVPAADVPPVSQMICFLCTVKAEMLRPRDQTGSRDLLQWAVSSLQQQRRTFFALKAEIAA